MNATTTSPERTIPEAMVGLLRLALETGIDGVALGFGGLGADFPAPIEWQLHLERVDHFRQSELNGERNYLNVTMQIGSDVPSAYVGPHTSDDPYWYADEIEAWITTPRRNAAGEPIAAYTAAEKTRLAQDTALFVTAINNGWEPSRSIRRQDAESFAKYNSSGKELPLAVNRQFSALNWFYNEEGHPAHRGNGTDVSRTMHINYPEIAATEPSFAMFEAKRINPAEVLAMPLEKAPWYAPVAWYDDDTEEWVL